MMAENNPVPVRLRPVLGDAIGTTAFFRNRPLFQTVVSFDSSEPFDVVFLRNALVYVPRDIQAGVIDRISSYNRSVLVTTAFHQDTITRDLQRNNYRPYPVNIEAIHNAWVDRRRDTPIDPSTLPPHIYADWSLPPFSEIPDYEYKYGAIFIKD